MGGDRLRYDGTWEGWLTAVFLSYRPAPPCAIVEPDCQQLLGVTDETVVTDPAAAARVEAGIKREMGDRTYRYVRRAFYADDPDKATVLYRYVRFGMKWGRETRRHLSHPAVLAFDALSRQVEREVTRFTEFARFSRLDNGAYAAEIEPAHRILPLLMPFFVDRFGDETFVLYDRRHGEAALYHAGIWAIEPVDGAPVWPLAEEEKEMRRLWKRFYDDVAIRERINPALRRQCMPRKYWKHMTEMTTMESGEEGEGQ